MARIRTVKPEFWTDPDIAALAPLARLFFIGMWNFADDYGVLKDDATRLKLQVLPADDVDPVELLDSLVNAGLVVRMTAPDGTKVLVVRTFQVHQRIDKRAVGRWGHPDTFEASPTNPAQSPQIPVNPHLGKERKGREGKGVTTTAADAAWRDDFEEFYASYPRKREPDKAWRAYRKRRADGVSAEVIYGGLLGVLPGFRTRDPKMIPYPASWLNAGGYLDEPEAAPETAMDQIARVLGGNEPRHLELNP